ncbi:hypothetical protein [Rhizobium sp. RCAM05973]|uniref:hypothetical protein n=1 Tax=Rhizobium sp. RCAM05973 TaxID=2994066 RepID=UPI0022EBD369|nr:hypothetical protein [Rhizobium sp. RCAM05973]
MGEELSKRPSATSKWDATNEAANSLIDARNSARNLKTLRLRELRLAKEVSDAVEASAQPKKARPRKKP